MVPIVGGVGGSTKFVLSDRWIVYTKTNCYTEITFYMKQAVVEKLVYFCM